LLLGNRFVPLVANEPAGHRANRTSNQCTLGGLIVLVVPDDPADHCSSCTAKKRTVPRPLLRIHRSDC
jgi:hypothetical protein